LHHFFLLALLTIFDLDLGLFFVGLHLLPPSPLLFSHPIFLHSSLTFVDRTRMWSLTQCGDNLFACFSFFDNTTAPGVEKFFFFCFSSSLLL